MMLLFLSVAVWRAASAMTAMKPTLAASPACPTVLHLCPGVTVSPVLVCRPVTPLHPPAAVTWARSPRLSSRLTRCPRAAPDASPAPSAATSWKVWTLETVIWSVAIWATPTCLAKACTTTTTTTIIWPTGECLYVWVQRQVFHVCRRVTGLMFDDDDVTSFMSSVVLLSGFCLSLSWKCNNEGSSLLGRAHRWHVKMMKSRPVLPGENDSLSVKLMRRDFRKCHMTVGWSDPALALHYWEKERDF